MRNLKIRPLTLILILLAAPQVFGKEVALTIDDAPTVEEHLYSAWGRTSRFVDILKKEKIQTAFLCNPVRLDQSSGKERLQAYSDAGHFIGNHTYSHPNLNDTPVEEFLKEIDDADHLLSSFTTFKKWFRFPFLKEGSTVEMRDRVRQHLKENGYTNAWVTVDNYDYVINGYVQKGFSENLKVNLTAACEMLSDLTIAGLEEQNKSAEKYLKAKVPQVLLMHENDLEAYCLSHSIQRLKMAHWKIISPVKAFSDPQLSRDPNTLWLDQGRIAAVIAAKSGQKFKSKWESTKKLNAELERREIVKGLKAE